ncbi:MAG: alpha/beta fold hydrolase [Microbacteriaceae bacterium]|nr:alpha/beta fold hydrolase [Microbacteriaceae bacterium]
MNASWTVTNGILALGDYAVERGGVIRNAQLSWQSHGTLNAAGDNVIVYPTSYTAVHEDLSWLIGPDLVLDPEKWFIVIIDMFSNGLSSSAATDDNFPALVTMADNVRAQHRLIFDEFGATRIAASYGFSMGAGQAYHWAALYPEVVDRAIIVCGSAKTAVHNRVFLLGLLSILEASPEYLGGGRFSAEPAAALRAFGTIYAGWGVSQDFYRERLFETVLGAADLTSYLRTDWEDSFARLRAGNLYAQALTWLEADISANPLHDGEITAALSAITARVLLLPGTTDLYFRVADNAAECEHLTHGLLAPIESIWGHGAGSPQNNSVDLKFLSTQVRAWLAN